jgi:hypothetical protein
MEEYTVDIFKFIAEINKRGVNLDFVGTKNDEDMVFLKIHVYKEVPNSDIRYGKGILVSKNEYVQSALGSKRIQYVIMRAVDLVEKGFKEGNYDNKYPVKEQTDDKRKDS